MPILGVSEPGVKAALEATRNCHIAVIGTSATVLSDNFKIKLEAKNREIYVVSSACPLLASIVDEDNVEEDIIKTVASLYLKPLKNKGVDTLILGCSHYRLLRSIIQEIMGRDVILIDSVKETAELAAYRLRVVGMLNEDEPPMCTFYLTDISQQWEDMAKRFFGKTLGDVKLVPLDVLEQDTFRSNHFKVCQS